MSGRVKLLSSVSIVIMACDGEGGRFYRNVATYILYSVTSHGT